MLFNKLTDSCTDSVHDPVLRPENSVLSTVSTWHNLKYHCSCNANSSADAVKIFQNQKL